MDFFCRFRDDNFCIKQSKAWNRLMGKCMATGKETAGKLQNVWLF